MMDSTPPTEGDDGIISSSSAPFLTCSTGYREGFFEATSSGTGTKIVFQRKRPSKSKRSLKGLAQLVLRQRL